MDDVARAAGLSRQGLYIHFPTKEELFKAGVLRLVAATREAGRQALVAKLRVDEKVLGFFIAIHAPMLGQLRAEHLEELMEAARHLVGNVADELEREQSATLAKVLQSSGVAAAWKRAGISARDLAAQLFDTSHGVKVAVESADEYRHRMWVAVQLVCSGHYAKRG
jgi:AcrR family transcriptional regulator